MEAYLDVETTGLSPYCDRLTVVGICLGEEAKVIQLVGRKITAVSVLKALEAVTTVYTYNGSRFDLPFLRIQLGIDLLNSFTHRDLMLDCWASNLYGGLKVIEQKLGLPRILKEIDGREAIRLWRKYEVFKDSAALRTLLEYNREDVLNLRFLKETILRMPPHDSSPAKGESG